MTQLKSLLLVATLSGIAACGGAGGSGKNAEEAPELFRVVHAAPNSETINVIAGEATVADGLLYGKATTYFDVDEGKLRVRVKFSGDALAKLDKEETIDAGKTYTYLVTETSEVEEATLIEDALKESIIGQFRLRFINAAEAAGAVDVYILPKSNKNADISSRAADVSNVAFKAAGDYLDVDAGSYRFIVTPAGGKKLLIDSGVDSYSEGNTYSIIVVEREGGGAPYKLKRLLDSSS